MDAGREYRVVIVGTVHGLERAGLDHYLDQVMEELLSLEAMDPSIDVEFSTATVRVAVGIGASNPLDAAGKASGFIRSAIHAAGGMTPDWPSPADPTWTIEMTAVEAQVAVQGEHLADQLINN